MLEGFAQLPTCLAAPAFKGFAERQGLTLDFEHVESLRGCALGERAQTELPGGDIVVKKGTRTGIVPA